MSASFIIIESSLDKSSNDSHWLLVKFSLNFLFSDASIGNFQIVSQNVSSALFLCLLGVKLFLFFTSEWSLISGVISEKHSVNLNCRQNSKISVFISVMFFDLGVGVNFSLFSRIAICSFVKFHEL